MESKRTPQETQALLDIAYVLRFGHFPCDDQTKPKETHNPTQSLSSSPSPPSSSDSPSPTNPSETSEEPSQTPTETSHSPQTSTDTPQTPTISVIPATPDASNREPSFPKEFPNPFAEDEDSTTDDQNPENPFKDDQNSLTDDTNPFAEDLNPFSEDAEEDRHSSSPSVTKGSIPHITVTGPTAKSPAMKSDVCGVSSLMVQEVIADLFNVTRLDMGRLVEEVSRNKETPSVELLLEEMQTAGLGLEPTTGSVSPPVVFVRAVVGSNAGFTTFTSTTATKAMNNTLTLNVDNMYKDTLQLQVWRASLPPVVESTSAPVLDIITRLINSASRLPKDTTSTPTTAKNNEEIVTASGTDAREPQPDSAVTNIDSPRSSSRENTPDKTTKELLHNGDEPKTTQDGTSGILDSSDTVSMSSDFSPEDTRTSTPQGRSASFQSLELSGIESGKNKKKGKMSNIRTSLRASFRKGSQSNLEKTEVSPTKQPDGDETIGEERRNETNDTSKDHGKEKLKRSGSLISVTSFSRMNFSSLRLSSQRASEVVRKLKYKKGQKSQSVTSTPEPYRKDYEDDNRSITSFQTDGALPGQNHSGSPNCTGVENSETVLDVTPMNSSDLRKSFKSMFSTPRTLRTFKSFRDKGNRRQKLGEDRSGSPDQKSEEENAASLNLPHNPDDIHNYLVSINKSHLKADLVAHLSIPIKSIVGIWKKEGWLPLTVIQDPTLPPTTTQKKRKALRGTADNKSSVISSPTTNTKPMCKFHVRLTLPTPECELATSGYDSYNITFRKMAEMQVQSLPCIKQYKGEVGPLGDVLLQQLVFFSRVPEPQRTLAKWLTLVELKPSDPSLLLPLLQAIKVHLEAGLYLTIQKRELNGALVTWVRKVLADEFEMLHSSFPTHTDLLELPRLEHFLRCFNTVETCYELRVMFEREMAALGLACLTDLLQTAVTKHVDTWVEALNKEQLTDAPGNMSENMSNNTMVEWQAWQRAQRRASHLTMPIVDFLTVSYHAYQPIFMVELSVDYLYQVMPRMVRAAMHLVNPLLKYDVDGEGQVPIEELPTNTKAAWIVLTNLSRINKIGIDSRLPQHLIPQEYCDAFNVVALQWIALSKHLAIREFEKDIQEDTFEAVDDLEGYSQSAVGVADLMKAMMGRVEGVQWPGGMGPKSATLTTMGQQLLELASYYTDMVTQAYVHRGTSNSTITTQACVLMRSVEHVCDEVRKHLVHLGTQTTNKETKDQLEDRTHLLQEHVDDAAETLLRQCMPRVEKLLSHQASWEVVVDGLKDAIKPVEDRIYFADPLLQQLWFRLFQHAKNLKDIYVKGEWRHNLRQLRTVLAHTHNFLTDNDGIGLSLPDEVTKEYDTLQESLMMLCATTAELVAQFYHERFTEQQREQTANPPILILNAAFMESGLRVHVVQSPCMAQNGVLIKVRLEPSQWFPSAEPRKTNLVKGDPAVLNEVFEFGGVKSGYGEEGNGGALTLQVRTPKLFSSATVHYESVLPLAHIPFCTKDEALGLAHTRLPLTRPWSLASYKHLEALKTRALDKSAADFLKALSERWEPNETSVQIKDSQKLASFVRAGSVRTSLKAAKKTTYRGSGGAVVK